MKTAEQGQRVRYAETDPGMTLTSLQLGTAGTVQEVFQYEPNKLAARVQYDTHPFVWPITLLSSLEAIDG